MVEPLFIFGRNRNPVLLSRQHIQRSCYTLAFLLRSSKTCLRRFPGPVCNKPIVTADARFCNKNTHFRKLITHDAKPIASQSSQMLRNVSPGCCVFGRNDSVLGRSVDASLKQHDRYYHAKRSNDGRYYQKLAHAQPRARAQNIWSVKPPYPSTIAQTETCDNLMAMPGSPRSPGLYTLLSQLVRSY